MAIAKDDRWLVIAGLGAVAFGYWYWTKNKDQTSSGAVGSDSASESGTDNSGQMAYYSGLDMSGNWVTTPNQVTVNTGSGQMTPGGVATNPANTVNANPVQSSVQSVNTVSPASGVRTTVSNGQAMPIGTNM
jgi:hypothetical protein